MVEVLASRAKLGIFFAMYELGEELRCAYHKLLEMPLVLGVIDLGA